MGMRDFLKNLYEKKQVYFEIDTSFPSFIVKTDVSF